MSDEEDKAKAAVTAGPTAGKTLFQKIIDREIPADIIYEDDHVSSFVTLTAWLKVYFVLITHALCLS